MQILKLLEVVYEDDTCKLFLSIGVVFMFVFLNCDDQIIDKPHPGFVHGYVYEADSNEPVDSARVYFNPESDLIYTDANGYYLIFSGID
ncbi:MAG: hypothetical protein GF404_04645 [candidate division Zixibacteria bacterium]|nr:hypothetical protein [candidate division Zixibacteria bacterium]